MGLTSLQVCMDSISTDWLQGTIQEECGMDCSSPSSGDMLTCSRPLIERRLRPPHDQALKCPRCDSTHTKFCYYNNYSLSQPRYFCKTCRRYWTKGGTLRNIPVGGGCRKNKKVAKKSSNNNNNNNNDSNSNSNSNSSSPSPSLHLYHHHHNPTDLQLSFPAEVQLSHINTILNQATFGNPNFMLENPNNRPIDFMESKLEAIVGSSSSRNNYDFMGNNNGISDIHHHHHQLAPNYHNLSPFGMCSLDDGANNGSFMDTCQRLMLPYDDQIQHQGNGSHDGDECSIDHDVKPNTKLLSLEWQDQGYSDNNNGKDTFGYLNNSWTGMINGYGSSTTNPLV